MKELLEVPEELKGKEVDSLIVIQGIIITNISYSLSVASGYDIIHKLYSQPFQPEMLGKYFGIKFKTRGTRYDHYELEGIQTTHILLDKNFLTLSINYGAEYTFPLPKTLADFIECCRMAGIELKWK